MSSRDSGLAYLASSSERLKLCISLLNLELDVPRSDVPHALRLVKPKRKITRVDVVCALLPLRVLVYRKPTVFRSSV